MIVNAISKAVDRVFPALSNAPCIRINPNEDEQAFMERIAGYEKKFDEAMDDDLNTADALGAIFELVKDANVSIGEKSSKAAAKTALNSLNAVCSVLGFLTKEEGDLPPEITEMLAERENARRNKDWKRSDELRDALKDAGFIVEDTKNGQKVRKNV